MRWGRKNPHSSNATKGSSWKLFPPPPLPLLPRAHSSEAVTSTAWLSRAARDVTPRALSARRPITGAEIAGPIPETEGNESERKKKRRDKGIERGVEKASGVDQYLPPAEAGFPPGAGSGARGSPLRSLPLICERLVSASWRRDVPGPGPAAFAFPSRLSTPFPSCLSLSFFFSFSSPHRRYRHSFPAWACRRRRLPPPPHASPPPPRIRQRRWRRSRRPRRNSKKSSRNSGRLIAFPGPDLRASERANSRPAGAWLDWLLADR